MPIPLGPYNTVHAMKGNGKQVSMFRSCYISWSRLDTIVQKFCYVRGGSRCSKEHSYVALRGDKEQDMG